MSGTEHLYAPPSPKINKALLAAGYTLDYVHDGGERVKKRTQSEALDPIDAVDAATLYVEHAHFAHLFCPFVLGNSPEGDRR